MHVWERSNRKRCWRCARVYIHVAGRIVCFCGPFSQLPQQRRCWLAEGLFVAGVMAAEVTLPCPFVRASSPSPPPPPVFPRAHLDRQSERDIGRKRQRTREQKRRKRRQRRTRRRRRRRRRERERSTRSTLYGRTFRAAAGLYVDMGAGKSEQESSPARSRIGDLFGNYCTRGR